MKAIWNDEVLAESDATVVVEGNHYFPPDSLKRELFASSETRSHCGWKGEAHYYNVVVGSETNADAAWFYPAPLDAARQITGITSPSGEASTSPSSTMETTPEPRPDPA